MYCHICGKRIPDGSKFCRYCGTRQQLMPGGPAEPPRPQPGVGPSAESPEYHYSYVKAQPQPAPKPQPRPQPQPAPPPRPAAAPQPRPQPQTAPGAMLGSGQCVYKVALDSEFKKFEFGGMPEGTVEIYEDRLQFFKKSKAVAVAFGQIGRALNGKGKEDIVLFRRDLRPGTVTAEKTLFQFYLTDGRRAYIQFGGHGAREGAAAMRRFLNI